jgi:PQQ-dependent catabolism-associated CXXCW motif protein
MNGAGCFRRSAADEPTLFTRHGMSAAVRRVARGAVGTAPAEPAAYRQDNYREPTPATVNGKPPTTTADAHRLWEAHSALFVDVLPAARRPDGLPSGAVWAPWPRLDIPGSIWLPDVGRGTLSPELEAWFRAELERITA